MSAENRTAEFDCTLERQLAMLNERGGEAGEYRYNRRGALIHFYGSITFGEKRRRTPSLQENEGLWDLAHQWMA